MQIRNSVIEIIEFEKKIETNVSIDSDLFKDLGFDSLSFVKLLIRLEEMFFIDIEIQQMKDCHTVGGLIKIIVDLTSVK